MHKYFHIMVLVASVVCLFIGLANSSKASSLLDGVYHSWSATLFQLGGERTSNSKSVTESFINKFRNGFQTALHKMRCNHDGVEVSHMIITNGTNTVEIVNADITEDDDADNKKPVTYSGRDSRYGKKDENNAKTMADSSSCGEGDKALKDCKKAIGDYEVEAPISGMRRPDLRVGKTENLNNSEGGVYDTAEPLPRLRDAGTELRSLQKFDYPSHIDKATKYHITLWVCVSIVATLTLVIYLTLKTGEAKDRIIHNKMVSAPADRRR